MKSSEQFKNSIFAKKEHYIAEKRKKHKKLIMIVTPVAACFVLCFGLFASSLMDTISNTFRPQSNRTSEIERKTDLIPALTLTASVDLMGGISSQTVNCKVPDNRFVSNTADFSINLFKKSIEKDNNSLVSPLSVMLALSMTANGTDHETLSQMEKVLGWDMTIEDLNQYLCAYINSLPNTDKSKLKIANSIWFRNGLSVKNSFLQTNANYYGASVYQSAFDDQTLVDINNWVNKNTDGMINSILNNIDDQSKMYLINALAFDAEWENNYGTKQVNSDVFTAIDGSSQTADFMHSDENLYLDDGKATGFLKPYAGGNYSFAALLPNQSVSIEKYVQTLSGDSFLKTIKNAKNKRVDVFLPKFSYDDTYAMRDTLMKLGMTDAFSDKADFGNIEPDGGLYINQVIHKTFIAVDESGTKAGAATIVAVDATCAPNDDKPITIKLNRPFVYAIIDNSTDLPVFIGTVLNINQKG